MTFMRTSPSLVRVHYLFCAAVASSIGTDDHTCLVQRTSTHVRNVRSQARQIGPTEQCGCLDWAEVFSSRGVVCGQGPELFHGVLDQPKTEIAASDPIMNFLTGPGGATYKLFCHGFFPKLRINYGISLAFESLKEGSFCYVDASCPGAKRVPGTNVSWKACDKTMDKTLSDLDPEELFRLSKQLKLNIGILLGYAYRINTGRGDPESQAFTPSDEVISSEDVAAARATGGPVVLQSAHCVKNRCTDRMVVQGAKAWKLTPANATAYMIDPAGPGAEWSATLLAPH